MWNYCRLVLMKKGIKKKLKMSVKLIESDIWDNPQRKWFSTEANIDRTKEHTKILSLWCLFPISIKNVQYFSIVYILVYFLVVYHWNVIAFFNKTEITSWDTVFISKIIVSQTFITLKTMYLNTVTFIIFLSEVVRYTFSNFLLLQLLK